MTFSFPGYRCRAPLRPPWPPLVAAANLRRPATPRVAFLALAIILGLAGCRSGTGTVLVVTVSLSGSLPSVAGLDVTLTGPAGASQKQYPSAGAIVFPTTLTAQLPERISGDLTLDIKAMGADGAAIAHGRTGPFTVRVGERQYVLVQLDCGGERCTAAPADGGTSPTDGAADAAAPSCGNGRIDLGELCDIAIAAGAPGACPPADCDDGIPCTTDTRSGDRCRATCTHVEVTTRAAGDKCCPAGATPADDLDCPATCGNGVVDVGETCDTGIAASAPGSCPPPTSGSGPTHCEDHDPCTQDLLIAAGTCSAICTHTPVTTSPGDKRDGCCPVGARRDVDVDCPTECGDGVVQADDGETCDVGIASTVAGGCPHTCDDGDPCTLDVRSGAACTTHCVHTPITALVSGDGCCPPNNPNANRRTDRDCTQTCGNKVVEPGEACDKEAKGQNACPTSCPPSPSACLESTLVGSAADCTARCELVRVDVCRRAGDGCCADGCTAANDPDCSSTCGDGIVQAANGEVCDTAIAPGQPGACPRTCSDGVACTRDVLVATGTCQAACLFLPITAFRAGDGCCPPGGDASLDPDCAPVCGDGVAEAPGETCDYAAATGACPATCPAGDSCTRVRLEGAVGACTAACVAREVTACVSGDGCCPGWCTIAGDADCPAVCGDGVRSAGEACDRGITAGLPGACAATCDDGDACTLDAASGTVGACTRACSHTAVTACLTGDGCCPAGCTATADRDCAPSCGDGRIGSGETCDPPATCPVTCPDDGDPCTIERLAGTAGRCDVTCRHDPVTTCSGKAADLCCPTGCGPDKDVDCPAWGPR